MFDVEKFVDGVHEYIERALKPLAERVKAIESRPAPKDGAIVTIDDLRPVIAEAVSAIPSPKDGKDGKDGASVVLDDVLPALVQVAADAAKKAVADIPPPKDGVDGKSVTLEDVRPLIEDAIKAIPPPKDGRDGKDGSSVTLDDVLPTLREDVQKAIALMPVPKDGVDGMDGADGKSISVDDLRQMFEAEQAKWALDFERRAQDVLQKAIDKMPAPKDGKDGLGFDDLTVEDDGDGNVILKFQRDGMVKEFALHFPRFKYCGVWTDQAYREGDGATFGGSLWLAKKDNPEGKPGQSDDWQLAVKKGRDGKDGKDGVMVEPPAKPVIKVPPR